jgi:predicted  nucleic acid-binding Zn-ribbon protein
MVAFCRECRIKLDHPRSIEVGVCYQCRGLDIMPEKRAYQLEAQLTVAEAELAAAQLRIKELENTVADLTEQRDALKERSFRYATMLDKIRDAVNYYDLEARAHGLIATIVEVLYAVK